MDYEAHIEELEKRMVSDKAVRTEIPAGLTYFGQLVAHDILEPSRPVYNPFKKAERKNITPYINLECVYGDLFNDRPNFKNNVLFDAKGCFRIKKVKNFGFDFERKPIKIDSTKIEFAVIPDQRNDDNVLISQMHTLWQRLHNCLIRNEFVYTPLEAYKLVTKTFLLILIEEHLKLILHQDIYEWFITNLKYIQGKQLVIPNFFSKAAFRFGHSMVQPSYLLKYTDNAETGLNALFNPSKSLTKELSVDWPLFFSYQQGNFSALIDTKISSSMQKIPSQSPNSNTVNILQSNLQASKLLPTGKQLFNVLQNEIPIQIKAISQPEMLSVLGDGHYHIDSLPLWPYLLLEAELNAKQFKNETLGYMGSYLVANVLLKSIGMSGFNLFSHNRNSYDFDNVFCEKEKYGALLQQSMANAEQIDREMPKITLLGVHDFIMEQEKYND